MAGEVERTADDPDVVAGGQDVVDAELEEMKKAMNAQQKKEG